MGNPFAQGMRDLRNRLLQMVGRGILRVLEADGSAQRLQVELLAREVRGRIDHAQAFGVHTVPLEGAEVVVVFPGGNRGDGLALVVADARHAPDDLVGGESCLYDATGQRVHLRADGSVLIQTSGRLVVDGDLEVAGSVSASGQVSDASSSMQAMRDTYNVHSHPGASGPPNAQQ